MSVPAYSKQTGCTAQNNIFCPFKPFRVSDLFYTARASGFLYFQGVQKGNIGLKMVKYFFSRFD